MRNKPVGFAVSMMIMVRASWYVCSSAASPKLLGGQQNWEGAKCLILGE